MQCLPRRILEEKGEIIGCEAEYCGKIEEKQYNNNRESICSKKILKYFQLLFPV